MEVRCVKQLKETGPNMGPGTELITEKKSYLGENGVSIWQGEEDSRGRDENGSHLEKRYPDEKRKHTKTRVREEIQILDRRQGPRAHDGGCPNKARGRGSKENAQRCHLKTLKESGLPPCKEKSKTGGKDQENKKQ